MARRAQRMTLTIPLRTKPVKAGWRPTAESCWSSLQHMGTDLDYLIHLARESARFGEALGGVPPDAAVPSCPDWTADDLLWHLGEVQWFWGTVVREKLTGSQAEELKPQRPADRAGLFSFFGRISRDLGEILAEATPDTPAWTWSDEQTVGSIRRRQAHEALIHRVDAELAGGIRTPMDPADGKSYDEAGVHAADSDAGEGSAAMIGGSAADLDCWLWRRPPVAAIERSGDQEVLSRFGPWVRTKPSRLGGPDRWVSPAAMAARPISRLTTRQRRLLDLDRQLVDLRRGMTGLVVHPEYGLFRRTGRQAERLSRLRVEPGPFEVHALGSLDREIARVRLAELLLGHAGKPAVNVHELRHVNSS